MLGEGRRGNPLAFSQEGFAYNVLLMADGDKQKKPASVC